METIKSADYTILVVDDTPELRDITVRALKMAGFSVSEASDGKECLAFLERETPDIILLDVILPDINGKVLCTRIKTDHKSSNAFIILLSSFEKSVDKIVYGLEGGADGYIVRPVSNEELVARVYAACRIVKTERELRTALKDIRTSYAEIDRFNQLLIDREMMMVELKKEVNRLLREAGKEEKYKVVN